MTVKETISYLSKMPEDMHLLIDSDGRFTELQGSDIKYIHKSKLDKDLASKVQNLISSDFEYIGTLKAN